MITKKISFEKFTAEKFTVILYGKWSKIPYTKVADAESGDLIRLPLKEQSDLGLQFLLFHYAFLEKKLHKKKSSPIKYGIKCSIF